MRSAWLEWRSSPRPCTDLALHLDLKPPTIDPAGFIRPPVQAERYLRHQSKGPDQSVAAVTPGQGLNATSLGIRHGCGAGMHRIERKSRNAEIEMGLNRWISLATRWHMTCLYIFKT